MLGIGRAVAAYQAYLVQKEYERVALIHQEQVILNARMELQRNSMQKFCSNKEDIARFVRKLVSHLAVGSQLTITIEREKFAEYFVTGVTSSESDAAPAETKSDK